MRDLEKRVERRSWSEIQEELNARGCAVLPELLTARECGELTRLFADTGRFRKRIDMAKHGFGRGEYQYFGYPLPPLVEELRTAIYPHLTPVANTWNSWLKSDVRFPATLAEFLERCHAAGQVRPTPLMLQYGEGDFNCLHQDLYGEHVFPLQLAILLSRPGTDFTGGEFVMTEQSPRAQSRPEVVPLAQGDGVIFAVHRRPVPGKRGYRRVNMRHGVSRLRSGHRHTLGIIFHDAR